MPREAALLLLAEIDQATKKKWKQHLKQPTLFKDTATKLLTELVKGKEAQIPEDLMNQAVEAGSKLLMGSFDAVYEAAIDSIGKAIEETSGEQAKAVLDRVLLMDVIDRIAYVLALKGILMNVDEEAWNEKGSQLANKLGGFSTKLGKEFFAKGLGKKALKKVKNIKPEDWGKAVTVDAEKAAASAAKTYLPKVLENFKTYAKQMEEGAGQEGKQEEQKAASVRFADLAQPILDTYLATIGEDAARILMVVPPRHWAQFANTVLATKTASEEVVIAAENLEKLVSPERHEFFTSPVDIMDGFGVGIATAQKLFTAIIKPCRKKDHDPKRPASEQKVCLYSKKNPDKLLGRHPSEEAARKQEVAIQINKHGSKRTAFWSNVIIVYPMTEQNQLKSDEFDKALDSAVNEYSSFEDGGSGESGAERDLSYSFSLFEEAENFSQKVEELAATFGVEEVTVNVSEEEDEGDWDDEVDASVNNQGKGAPVAKKKATKTSKRSAAAKQKVASLLKEGKAIPVLAKKDGSKWVPDLTDSKTRKAFVKYVQAHGISAKDLQFVLKNQKVAVGPFRGRGKGRPQDSADAAIAMLRDEFGVDLSSEVQAVPDPQVEGVWLVFDHGNRYAHIVYLFDHDFETVDNYSEAYDKYGRDW